MDQDSLLTISKEQLEHKFSQLNSTLLFDFEKFLFSSYILKDNCDFVFLAKLLDYLEISITARKQVSSKKIEIYEAQKDFSQFFIEFLIDKHILGFNPEITQIPEAHHFLKSSQYMLVQELPERLRNIFHEQQECHKILAQMKDGESFNKVIRFQIGINTLFSTIIIATSFLHLTHLFSKPLKHAQIEIQNSRLKS